MSTYSQDLDLPEADFDPAKLAEKSIESNLDPTVFDQISDGGIRKPHNFFEWVNGKQFLNVTPFPKQVEIGINFFGQFCPRCTDPSLMEDERWGNKLLDIPVDYPLPEIIDRVAFLVDGVCPKCKISRQDLVTSKELNHYSNLNGCAGMRCVSGDTVLFTKSGIKTIREIDPGHVELGFIDLGIDVASKNGMRTASDHYYAGQSKAVEIELQYGLRITGSFIHPVEVLGGDGIIKWKKLGDLSVNDRVHVVPGSDVWGDQIDIGYCKPEPHFNSLPVKIPSVWSKDLARFLGYIVSDGTYNSNYIVAFSVSDPDIRSDYLGLCQRLFGLSPKPRNPGKTLEAGFSCEHLAFCSVEVRKFLRFLGVENVTGRWKTIPKSILSASREIVLSFLGGLFLGDGGFYERIGGKKVTITYTTVSEDLATMLQQILLNLGVLVTLGRCDSRKFASNEKLGHDAFFMCTKTIEDGALLGSVLEPHLVGEKRNRATNIRQAQRDNHSQMFGSGPAARALLAAIQGDKPNLRFKEAKAVLSPMGGATRLKYVKTGADISRQLAVELLDATRARFGSTEVFKWLQSIVDAPGRFLGIRKITRIVDPIDLYDLNVPDGHEFLTNGIVSHNSSKTVTVGGLMGTYQVARFLLLKSPSKYFNLMENQTLHSTFVAITAGQAKDTLWQAFKDRVDSAPWFKDYHIFLEHEAKRLGKEKFFDIKETFISYDHKQIICSYSGPDIRTIRGRTRFFCVTGDTLVNTEKGWLRMDELAEGRPLGPSPMEIEVMTGDDVALTSHFHCSGVSPTIRVTTESGYEIAGTPDHPLFVIDDHGNFIETKLKDIEVGNYVTMRRGALFPDKQVKIDISAYRVVGPHGKYKFPEILSPDLAWLMGIILAEGTVRYSSPQKGFAKWSSGDKEVIAESTRIFEEMFGHPIPIEVCPTLQIPKCQSPRVGKFFVDLGLGGKAKDKTIPSIIRKAPKEIVAAFISGYFDGDSHSEKSHIAVHSASRHLLKDLQVLLMGFGILSKRKNYVRDFNDGRGPQEYALLRVYSHNIDRFHQEIGYLLTRKKLQEPCYRMSKEKIPVQGCIGNRRVDSRRFACEDGETRRVQVKGLTGFLETHTRRSLNDLNLEALKEIDSKTADFLSRVRDRPDVVFEQVEKVEPSAEEPVFDLTVPETHQFVAANFLNKNTGIDEKGWFDVQADSSSMSTKVRMNAGETHTALVKSLRTIRSAAMKLRASGIAEPPDGINADVSSPSSLNDSIMLGIREANENPTMYAFHFSTWEMNPNVPFDSLRDEMRDRRAFERDYAAVPPLGANQFIDSQKAVERCQNKKSQSTIVNWTKRYITDDFGDKTMYIEVKPIKKDKNRPCMLAVDTGLSNNSFAVELWSYDKEYRHPTCEVAIECMPEETETEKILVNFPMMFRHAILPLVESRRVILAAYDRWSSIEQVQMLRIDHRIEAIQYTLKWADFQAIRAAVIDSGIRFPLMEMGIDDVRKSDLNFEKIVRDVPVTHLALQLLTVREGGRKVLKPINGTDDLFRCLCLAVKFILDPKYMRKFEQYGSGISMTPKVVGVVRTNYSGPAGAVARATPGTSNETDIGVRKSFVGTLK